MKNRRPTALPASISACDAQRQVPLHPPQEATPVTPETHRWCHPRNDVEVWDIEGRSALPRCKGEDHTDATAIAPEIRLFDASFGLDTFIGRQCIPTLAVAAGCEVKASGLRPELGRASEARTP